MWLVISGTIGAMLLLPILALFVLSRLVQVTDFNTALLLTAIGAVGVGIVVGWVLLRILLRPITALAARADDIRTGQTDALAPLDHYGTSEMEAMGRSMRQMGKVLQDREAVLRSYADHVTHELKSPLRSCKARQNFWPTQTFLRRTENRWLVISPKPPNA